MDELVLRRHHSLLAHRKRDYIAVYTILIPRTTDSGRGVHYWQWAWVPETITQALAARNVRGGMMFMT
jgi:hypothetical protein